MIRNGSLAFFLKTCQKFANLPTQQEGKKELQPATFLPCSENFPGCLSLWLFPRLEDEEWPTQSNSKEIQNPLSIGNIKT